MPIFVGIIEMVTTPKKRHGATEFIKLGDVRIGYPSKLP
jgi:hypothetical protein